MKYTAHLSLAICGWLLVMAMPANGADSAPTALNEAEWQAIRKQREDLDSRLKQLKPKAEPQTQESDRWADASIFVKGLRWAELDREKFQPADVALLRKALQRGEQRAESLTGGQHPWTAKTGKVVRGYVSAIDGSVQPFGLFVPKGYDAAKPMRLDVVLHGSSRPVGLSELRFMNTFDDGDEGGQPVDQDFLELRPLGRIENCYRWSGETDVFEAIETVCRNYNVNRQKVVLRGMSMGASGTWHVGLKHPDRFVALGPYCGYVDTYQMSLTPLKNFVKVETLPTWQQKALHLNDAQDYAANGGVVPAIACMGEKDIFFQAHVIMGRAMQQEKVQLINLISPGTGHVVDPVTFREQMRLIRWAIDERDPAPRDLRFVTWSLKYHRCHWLDILGLNEHYARTEIVARVAADRSVSIEPKNVTRLALRHTMPSFPPQAVTIDRQEVKLPSMPTDPRRDLIFVLDEGRWKYLGLSGDVKLDGKRPGLQGPIDDAFMSPFLCVRGTGTAWNPAVAAYADAALRRFSYEWHRYFRGDLPVKDDKEVTASDLKKYNLILFGDPGSNSWIAKALPGMPVTWTREEITVGGTRYSAENHVPAVIYPNPLPGATNRYVVLNTGHTFHEPEHVINYLLFPRWGDWAILKVGSTKEPLEELVRAEYFDEFWKVRKP
jgi:pimeloyl-ACP methyl ester carboxylesterase